MRRYLLIACAAVALGACGSKKDVVENGTVADNLTFESNLANDASALEAVEAQNARQAVPEEANKAEDDNSQSANSGTNAVTNAASDSN